MADQSSEAQGQPQSPVRIIGSRELHQSLPALLRELEKNPDSRYVLTVHGKPKAVLIGAAPFLRLLHDQKGPGDTLVGLQLTALLGGQVASMDLDDLEKSLNPGTNGEADPRPR